MEKKDCVIIPSINYHNNLLNFLAFDSTGKKNYFIILNNSELEAKTIHFLNFTSTLYFLTTQMCSKSFIQSGQRVT